MSHTAKPDIVLSDGREVTFDLYKISQREYRSIFDAKRSDIEGDEVVAKTCNLSADEIADLSQPEYKLFMSAFFARARKPVDDGKDPN